MRRPLSATLLTLLLTLCFTIAAAGDGQKKHPDFSGTWVVDRAKSDFGPFAEKPLARADSKSRAPARVTGGPPILVAVEKGSRGRKGE